MNNDHRWMLVYCMYVAIVELWLSGSHKSEFFLRALNSHSAIALLIFALEHFSNIRCFERDFHALAFCFRSHATRTRILTI